MQPFVIFHQTRGNGNSNVIIIITFQKIFKVKKKKNYSDSEGKPVVEC